MTKNGLYSYSRSGFFVLFLFLSLEKHLLRTANIHKHLEINKAGLKTGSAATEFV